MARPRLRENPRPITLYLENEAVEILDKLSKAQKRSRSEIVSALAYDAFNSELASDVAKASRTKASALAGVPQEPSPKREADAPTAHKRGRDSDAEKVSKNRPVPQVEAPSARGRGALVGSKK